MMTRSFDQQAYRQAMRTCFLSLALILICHSAAYAGPSSGLDAVLCAIVDIIYSGVGRGLAVLAVIVLGIGAMLGKVSWGLALTVGTGIGVVFGAPNLVRILVGSVYAAGGSGTICGY